MLASDIYLADNPAQPCPRCVAGVCDRGPRAGMACTTTSSTGLTRDCPTGGVGTVVTPCPVGPGSQSCCPTPATCNRPCTAWGGLCCDGARADAIAVNLSPLSNGSPSVSNGSGLFCSGQLLGFEGCFGSPACRTITENGTTAGPISTGTPASVTLASVFCIEGTQAGLIDALLNVPGPGAVALPGTFLVHN